MHDESNQQNTPTLVIHSPSPAPAPRQTDHIVVPPRVQLAMGLIQLLNRKTEPTIASGGGYEGRSDPQKFDGQRLTPTEELAHNAACDLLEKYFTGQFKPDIWEEPVRSGIVKRSRRTKSKSGRVIVHGIPCPACKGAGVENCPICRGDGGVLLIRRKDL